MANLSYTLPLPVLNGPGAAVDTSAMGSPKTIEVVGNFPGCTIAIEISTDDVEFAPLTQFQNVGGAVVLPCAASSMRVNVRGRKTTVSFSAECSVAANANGGNYIAITLPAGNGNGPAIALADFGLISTFVCGGDFQGATITVQISEDNLVWATIGAFVGQGGQFTEGFTAPWVRAVVTGRKSSVAFSAALSMGSVNDVPTTGVDVEDEGVEIPNNPHQTLNFVGAGVIATDMGGGVAKITIPGGGGIAGINVEEEGVVLVGSPYTSINFTGQGVTATDVAGVATVAVPGGITVDDEGVPIAGNPHHEMNFTGAGVTVTDVAGVATVTIAGAPADDDAVIFDDSVPGQNSNIRSDRLDDQSPIDNTQSQITNFGSADGSVYAAAAGATAQGATIGGGNDNEASDLNATVPGGSGNIAENENTVAMGLGADANIEAAVAEGGGFWENPGQAQGVRYTARGETPGDAPGETTTLGVGASPGITIPVCSGNNKTVGLDIVIEAFGIVHGDTDFPAHAIFQLPAITVSRYGTSTMYPDDLVGIPPTNCIQTADQGAEQWRVICQFTAPSHITIYFTTGDNAAHCRVVARLTATEVGVDFPF